VNEGFSDNDLGSREVSNTTALTSSNGTTIGRTTSRDSQGTHSKANLSFSNREGAIINTFDGAGNVSQTQIPPSPNAPGQLQRGTRTAVRSGLGVANGNRGIGGLNDFLTGGKSKPIPGLNPTAGKALGAFGIALAGADFINAVASRDGEKAARALQSSLIPGSGIVGAYAKNTGSTILKGGSASLAGIQTAISTYDAAREFGSGNTTSGVIHSANATGSAAIAYGTATGNPLLVGIGGITVAGSIFARLIYEDQMGRETAPIRI
jgi:hypothetical protein